MTTPNESRRDGKGPQQDGRTATPSPDVDLSLADVLRNIHHQMTNTAGELALLRSENASLRSYLEDLTINDNTRHLNYIKPTNLFGEPNSVYSEHRRSVTFTDPFIAGTSASAQKTLEQERVEQQRRFNQGFDQRMIDHPSELEQRLAGIEAMITRIPSVPLPIRKAAPNSFADSPFVDEIGLTEMPSKFTLPSMKLFNGTSDPNDHIAQYKQKMFIAAIPKYLREACMCKGFGSSLSGAALQWFTNLPNASIGSFAQLTDLFVEQFASSQKIEKHSDDLYAIIQYLNETLRNYVARFNREKVEIPGCNADTAISAFRKGLKRDSDLYKELTKYPCKTMDDILAKAWAQIKWEEDEDQYYRPKPRGRDEGRDSRRNDRRRTDPYPRNDRYKPQGREDISDPYDRRLPEYNLCITPSEAVNALKELGSTVKRPPKMRSPDHERDRRKYCEFHKDHSHRTDDCIALRLEIIDLLKRGHLKDLLTDKGKQTFGKNDENLRDPLKPPPIEHVVNCITGGFEVSGVSQASVKRHCRSLKYTPMIPKPDTEMELISLSFTNSEASELSHPYHDALVISVLISNYMIKRTLIDGGSSTNVIFLSTLKGMQVPEAHIVKKLMTLIGFSSEHKTTIGEITLPVYTEGVNLHTKFQIIDAPSTYNVILGRPWIHELKAVLSTYHQVIRFPTPWGIRQIRGEQITSRDCYRSAFKTNHVQVQEVNQIDEASTSNSKYECGESSNQNISMDKVQGRPPTSARDGRSR
ncbi:hypothetical protein C2S51_010691 [Perilla frutescens var. frutescens]|nr:hypothetical protein C2S51_010691 [Perilla frutescens var. frutescens]